ncbi:MAG: S8 family serine peptidase [Polyangiaceae bacterium]
MRSLRSYHLPHLGRWCLSSALLLALTTPANAAPSKLDGSLTLARTHSPSTLAKLRGAAAPVASTALPVVIELAAPLASDADAAPLAARGAVLDLDRDGHVLGRGSRFVGALVEPSRLDELASLPSVARLSLDGRPFHVPHPLELTASLISVDDVQRQTDAAGLPLRGAGITVCDVDAGAYPLHPMFFRADGGYFDWTDENENGVLDPGVDTIDLGTGPVVIGKLNGIVSYYYSEAPLFGTEDDATDLTYDYFYADDNGDGARNAGLDAGFTEATPTYGEQLLIADDVNGDGKLEVGEKLVALGTSKIKAFRLGSKTYRRGENLIEAPWEDSMLHGVGATGVIAGGQPGLGKLVGMAPDADLIMATDNVGGRELQMTNFCISEGARVVLHEYAPWITYHLDGSSALEQRIDETTAGNVAHINPAGNLSGSKKGFERALTPGAANDITIDVPPINATYMIASFLWRDVTRDLTFSVKLPNGSTLDFGDAKAATQVNSDGLTFYVFREDSDRGTAKIDLYAVVDTAAALPTDAWTVTLTDPDAGGAPVTVFGFVFDEVSGWGPGIAFPDDSTEDHLVGWPGTADHGMAIAAYTGHDYNYPSGVRAPYSGRGFRIDDTKLMSISAPDNPTVPGHFTDRELAYIVYGGTSGASPHVAGSAALYFQAHPDATGRDFKQAVEDHALVDEATGAVPNDDYGYGKLDTYAAVFGERAPESDAPKLDSLNIVVPIDEPTSVTIPATDDGPASELVLEVDRDYDGVYDETLDGGVLTLDYPEEGFHVLKLRATDATGRYAQALARVTVRTPEEHVDPPTPTPTHAEGDGCAIRAVGSTAEHSWVAAFLAMIGVTALAARKRRSHA